jgi:hypothetical protein
MTPLRAPRRTSVIVVPIRRATSLRVLPMPRSS